MARTLGQNYYRVVHDNNVNYIGMEYGTQAEAQAVANEHNSKLKRAYFVATLNSSGVRIG